jgi:hypothetical protein
MGISFIDNVRVHFSKGVNYECPNRPEKLKVPIPLQNLGVTTLKFNAHNQHSR